MALSAIGAHKLRSTLTLLGVMIGVFSIIVTMTAMRVLKANIEQELSELGTHTVQIQKWPGIYFGGPDGFEKFWRRKPITYDQVLRVKARATLPREIVGEDWFWAGQAVSRFEKTPPNVELMGVMPGSFPAHEWTLLEGRSLNDGDLDSARDICVLGNGLAKTLFPFTTPLGERVKFNGIGYTVVGVLASKGAMRGRNPDNFAAIPITTGLNRFGRVNRSLSLLVQAAGANNFDDTVEEVRGLLRTLRKVPPGADDDFEIFSNDSLIAQFDQFTGTVRIGVAAVSSIALLAAGIGIMNIMLVSVTERTREIGIRRAVGAKKRNILTQFILEAIILSELGGCAGVIFGLIGGNAAAYFLKLPPALPFDWVVLGLVICSIVGILFGTYPAWKAANLNPIDSLRYE